MPSQPSKDNQGPISEPINHLIDEQMDRITDANLPLMEKFGEAARQVAIAQSKTEGRGIILGLQSPSSKKFLHVQQQSIIPALWMTAVSFKRKVAQRVEAYDPSQEAVVVMVVPPTAQLFHATAGEMELLEIQEVEQTSIQLPAGVKIRSEQQGQVFIYNFTHKKLGKLGRIVVKPYRGNQAQIDYELADTGFDPSAKQRRDIFVPLAQELMQRIDLGLMG
ncbi:hypothetical protein [Acaryochloris sp. CCMEE 5410]|uniref:hypothetical protein n=1 Tax=Acaryochloris sp. CCMEE 5410 TaxID=310037 RepID=UPI00024846FA|nr:hypothetical protein [Acaryochloris sp. CCMEE 5410]KAI9129052.1 hypothetical protein ON05_036860 [Acaryochloris sp. CCMEE 5410]